MVGEGAEFVTMIEVCFVLGRGCRLAPLTRGLGGDSIGGELSSVEITNSLAEPGVPFAALNRRDALDECRRKGEMGVNSSGERGLRKEGSGKEGGGVENSGIVAVGGLAGEEETMKRGGGRGVRQATGGRGILSEKTTRSASPANLMQSPPCWNTISRS